jgi:hypothetical protein
MKGGGANSFEYGIVSDGAGDTQDCVFSDCVVLANSANGGYITQGTRITFRDCYFQANGTSTGMGLAILGGTDIYVRGGVYAAGFYSNGHDSQVYGVYVQNATNVKVSDLVATPNVTGSVIDAGGNTGLEFRNIKGYNPVGPSTVTPGASPWTYTAGPSPEVLYITNGTVSSIVKSGVALTASTNASIYLQPNQSVVVTYSVAPNVNKDIF